MAKTFPLGVVVVSVTSADGATHIEDWNPRDAVKAKEYAEETAQCGDVLSVDYYNAKLGETATFTRQLK